MIRTAIMCLLCAAPALIAQNGAITGTVADQDHKPVAKATITAKNAATRASFSATSAADGSYTLVNVPAGRYTLSGFLSGMIPYTQPNAVVAAAQTLHADVVLADFNANVAGEDREFYAQLWYPKEQIGRTPRRGGKPDLSGVWRPALPSDWGRPEPVPWAAAKIKEWQENDMRDFPGGHCLPQGLDVTTLVTPIKLVQTAKLLVILFDIADPPRQIFIDGRSHPKEYPLLAWFGHSIGHWEGDTLVVDSRGFNDKSWIGFPFHPHTEMLHTIERFRRPDFGHLEMQTTIDDRGAFSKPWTYSKVLRLAPPGEDLEEYVCNENNRDIDHIVGK
ncbi:MAG TPA: carboxypeptidase-like regulatory domain-containing protein [Bryobacteraceae bacterium]|nr:carboxypeptidase-like regulatory domain-containing protein [Bryobacteraceae bacterium]